MTRTRRALRLSPLAFALAFGAYSENFSVARPGPSVPEREEFAALQQESRKSSAKDESEA